MTLTEVDETAAPSTEFSFRHRFRERFKVSDDGFESACVRWCGYRPMRWFGWVAFLFAPGLFEDDLTLVRQVGLVTNWDEVVNAVRFHRRTTLVRGLLRGPLRMRISTERVLKLGAELFPSEREPV